jgi:hypothetical protein
MREHESTGQIPPPPLPYLHDVWENVVHDTWCPHLPRATYTNNDRKPGVRLPVDMGQPIG